MTVPPSKYTELYIRHLMGLVKDGKTTLAHLAGSFGMSRGEGESVVAFRKRIKRAIRFPHEDRRFGR
jgi:hypothetical protein